MNNHTWHIWIDTGGTFTDCLAFDPSGHLNRVKVLSSSALRGKIISWHQNNIWKVYAPWISRRSDLFTGYRFRLLNQQHSLIEIVKTDAEQSLVYLSASPDGLNWDSADFEITADEEAPILAARIATQSPLGQALPPLDMRLGSTKGTNALLEKKGTEVGLLITKGLGDLLEIGTQQRPDIFALCIEKPPLLYQQVIEVNERLDAEGKVLVPITTTELEQIIGQVKQSGLKSWAIALLHSYLNPIHENLLRERMLQEGITFISCSSTLAPMIKLLPRAQTAVVNAYLSEVMENYLRAVEQKLPMANLPEVSTDEVPLRESPLPEPPLRVMTSAGGLVKARLFQPKDSLLSGPAGGVVGAASVARLSKITHLLTLDMGGTSTDVARYAGEFDYQFESKVGHAQLFSPSLAIETVAAGGGSICWTNGLKLGVGPESAGAHPGPACYGAGGPLTITDVNLLLGRLDPDSFGIPLNRKAAGQALHQLREAISDKILTSSDGDLLEGFLAIANEKMAEAVRKISVSKGYDPAHYTLLAFGGAGGQHACRVAALLRMQQILIPYDAGLLSAYGMGQARIERLITRQILRPFQEVEPTLQTLFSSLSSEALQTLSQEGFLPEQLDIRLIQLFLRLKGQDHALEINYQASDDIRALFRQKYKSLYGHWIEGQTLELESIKVIASTKLLVTPIQEQSWPTYTPEASRFLFSYLDGKWQSIPVFVWERLRPGASVAGPAILVSQNSTTVVETAWKFDLDGANNIMLTLRPDDRPIPISSPATPEAIQLELFTNRFRAIAEEMGALLQRTAFSVNVKERLDFSCALLDAEGELVVNAPHIPVHLGSLGVCVRLVKQALPMQKGDVVITNHPGYGGSHLPDITLISPVYWENERLGYVANRAHHSEIGGTRPGSMPPDATCLAEEGVVIAPTYLVKGGVAQWETIRQLLMEGPYPTRSLAENLADLNAALASIQAGTIALIHLAGEHSTKQVKHFMQALKDYSATWIQKSIADLKQDHFSAEEQLDDGTQLVVNIDLVNHSPQRKIRIDFTGTGGRHAGNLNANPAIVTSAVIYVLRLLVNTDIPLNEGIMQAVELIIPRSLLNPDFPDNPFQCPAVVGGNTETSQRLVDTLLKAWGLMACSQGTMNNLLFGNQQFGYYETIGGGAGAGPHFPGASAVHTHMTNTRITDPEILEFRYPVRLEQFAIRQDSGGKGRHSGGNGIVREITFLKPVSLTLLSQHRKMGPYGLAGGEAGHIGEQYIVRKHGNKEILPGIVGATMEAGDRMVIQTPGGGGYGKRDA